MGTDRRDKKGQQSELNERISMFNMVLNIIHYRHVLRCNDVSGSIRRETFVSFLIYVWIVVSAVGIVLLAIMVFGYTWAVYKLTIERLKNGSTFIFKPSIRSSKEDGEHTRGTDES